MGEKEQLFGVKQVACLARCVLSTPLQPKVNGSSASCVFSWMHSMLGMLSARTLKT